MVRNHCRRKFKCLIHVYNSNVLFELKFLLILLLLTVVFFPTKFGVGIRKERNNKCLIPCFKINVKVTNLDSSLQLRKEEYGL